MRRLEHSVAGRCEDAAELLDDVGGFEPEAEMHKPRYIADEAGTRAWANGWSACRKNDVVWLMHSGGHYGYITKAGFGRPPHGRRGLSPTSAVASTRAP